MSIPSIKYPTLAEHLIAKRGWSQREFVRRLGRKGRGDISRILKGEQIPHQALAEQIVDVLGYCGNPEDLFKEYGRFFHEFPRRRTLELAITSRGLIRLELAKLCGMQTVEISDIVSGRRKVVYEGERNRIVEALEWRECQEILFALDNKVGR